MNKIAIAIAGALTLGAAASAQAQSDGTISFTGQVLATSCAINGGTPGSGGNMTVPLPAVAANALDKDGARFGETPFKITVGTNTDPCSQINVQAYFHNRGNVNAAGRLNNTGTATNVNVAVLNEDRADINLTNNTNSKVVALDGDGKAELNFYGEYYATGAATAGTVTSGVEYSLIYP